MLIYYKTSINAVREEEKIYEMTWVGILMLYF